MGKDNIFVIDQYDELFTKKDRKIEIPQSVVHISKEAFKDHPKVTKLTLHEGVKKLDTSAFENCGKLEQVKIFGDSELVVIPENCFKDCTSLQSFTITNEVGVIKKYAFSGCTGIDHLVIPEHVIMVEAGAFDKWTPEQTIEMYSNFKFGIVCKAKIINHSKTNEINDEDEIYETPEGKYMYCVTTKCGHVGRDKFMKIDFPVIAETRKEAAKIGRLIPRVKHNHKDAILNVLQIHQKEFDRLNEINKNDLYLQVKNSSQQKELDKLIDRRSLLETGNK